MATANQTEYLTLDGVPLSTEAWTTEDIATILDGPPTRGEDLTTTTRRGQVARRRVLDARNITIPLVVTGYYDSDGAPHADPRQGLLDNLDELKEVLGPDYATTEGTKLLRWYRADGTTREANVQVSPSVRTSAIGPHAVRLVVSCKLVDGVLRNVVPSAGAVSIASGVTSTTFTVNLGGTAQVEDVELGVTGLATWGSPSYAITAGTGAPTAPGTTGDIYFDLSAYPAALYRYDGASWTGPHQYTYWASAPAAYDTWGPDYWVVGSGGTVTGGVYGPRTIANPNITDVRVANLTLDPTGGVYVEYIGAITQPLRLYAGTYNAALGSTEVGGAIVNAGSTIWLPLVPGNNNLQVTFDASSADTAVYARARAVWL